MQNKPTSYKTLLVVILSILVGGGIPLCFALQEEADVSEEPLSISTEAREEPSAKATASEPIEKKPESEPATRFTPTEKIRAADAISLPVDI